MNLLLELLGEKDFVKLCEAFGGGDYNIPNKPCSTLTDAIGETAAHKLIQWGSGSRVYVPSLHCNAISQRRQEIQALRDQGLTLREIAKQYRYVGSYTERQIWTILNEEQRDLLEVFQADVFS